MSTEERVKYLLVGGGLAAASAVEGIRELDVAGRILMLAQEPHLPYHRPPLSKGLWSGKKRPDQIFVRDGTFYRDKGVEVRSGTTVRELHVQEHTVTDNQGRSTRYEKLLLATGAQPRHLPTGDVPGVCYFRTFDDYVSVRQQAEAGKTAVILGGGFIGSEMAAALLGTGVQVTMLFPSLLAGRVLPRAVAQAVQAEYIARGVQVLAGEYAEDITRDGRFTIGCRSGRRLVCDILVAGLGVSPDTRLAQAAGLSIDDGIVVNERLEASHADVFAAGDNARFPYAALGQSMRVEHWDNAQAQGKQAGRNMAGAAETYDHMPYFFSDLFDFGYEAVGEIDTRLDSRVQWEELNRRGTIYYLRDGIIRGMLMCNLWNKVDTARDIIRKRLRLEDLSAATTQA